MKELSVNQNTNEWLESRKTKIGSSDVAAILGISPWKTAFELWEVKTGKKEPEDNKYIFERGHRSEDEARVKFTKAYGIEVPPLVVQKEDLEYCQVSLDGINKEKKIVVEFKLVGREVYKTILEGGDIPPHYYAQVQYQLLATGYNHAYLVASTMPKLKSESKVNPFYTGIAVKKIDLDLKFIEKIVDACNKFYKCMIKNTPPELSNNDYKPIKKKAAKELCDKFILAKKAYDEATNKLKEIKSALEEYLTEPRMIYKNFKAVKVTRKGAVNYAKIPELKSVDLEKYRKKDIVSTRITIQEE